MRGHLEDLLQRPVEVPIQTTCQGRTRAPANAAGARVRDPLAAAACNDSEPGVCPQLTLRAKAMWIADDRNDLCCAKRSDPGHRSQQSVRPLVACLTQHHGPRAPAEL